MTGQEFERLQRRFGEDVSAWPAPYRQEGLRFLAGDEEAVDADDALDKLVLEAARTGTDEVALTRQVLAKINGERRPANRLAELRWIWATPAAAASGFAALLLLAAVAGYAAADRGLDATDDALMALALGGGIGNGEFDGGLPGELGEEEQL